MRGFRLLLAALILAATLLLPTLALAAVPVGGGGGDGWGGSSSDDEIVKDYRIARNLAVGLAAVGFLASAGWWAASGSHPEGRYRATWGMTIFAIAFVATVLDKVIVQGIAGWFLMAPGDLPLFWQ